MKKKPATLSDKLNKLFAPEEEHSEESDNDTAPKFSEFDEVSDEPTKQAGLSEIRKRNIRLLEDIDRKYTGAVASRSETFADDISGDESDDDGESSEDTDGDDKNFGKVKRKPLVLLKQPESEDESNETDQYDEDEGVDSNDDDDDDNEDEDEESASHDSGSIADDMNNGRSASKHQMKLIKEENKQEAINKGLAVQNQLKIWERMLEMRIKTHPGLIAANSLPPSSTYEQFCSQSSEFREKADQATKTVAETLDQLLELQERLLERYPETKDLLTSGSKRRAPSKPTAKSKRLALDGYEPTLASRSRDMVNYRNNVLIKWHDRTSIASKMRSQKQSLSITRKIEDSLINRDELVHKTQLYRGGYALIGRPVQPANSQPAQTDDREDDGTGDNQTVYDGEIFDDTDFYHQLLRELIEFKASTTDSPQEIANKLAELQKLRNKMKKKVDTKASKGRKIRYVVHNKLVNFMAPVVDYNWTDEAKDELFGSLFGQAPANADGS